MKKLFSDLIKLYAKTSIEFNHLKAITVAQWMLESGRGTSRLAQEHLNFGGLKWREEMSQYATKVRYQANDGEHDYCKFASLEKFIQGYWAFIERSPYDGWRNNTDSGPSYIGFIGPIYVGGDTKYVDKVLNLLDEAENILAEVDHGDHHPGTNEPVKKPRIKQFIQSPNRSSRSGAEINTIILHYTTASNVTSTINHFKNPAPPCPNNPSRTCPVSAHYIIDKNGDIYQMVADIDKAWHAGSSNRKSIGIEHVAKKGDRLTNAQEKSSIALIRWLMTEYKVPAANILAHKEAPGNATSCPGELFGDDGGTNSLTMFNAWVAKHFEGPMTSIGGTDVVTEETATIYIVKPGDTFFRIATNNGMSVAELEALNPNISDTSKISVGQRIIVSANVYIVKSGDTFFGIATSHGMSVEELKTLNPNIQDITTISLGQRIILSGSLGGQTGDNETVNLPFKIAEKFISAAAGTHQPFSNPVLGSGKITGGFMEEPGHSSKGALKAIFLDNSLKTLPPAKRNIGIDYVINDHQVKAWYSGKVTRRGLERGYGNRVQIQLDIEFDFQGVSYAVYQAFAHLRSISVSVGETINQGQTIGVMGGSSTKTQGGRLILVQDAYPIHIDLDTYIRKNGERISINPQLIDKQLGWSA